MIAAARRPSSSSHLRLPASHRRPRGEGLLRQAFLPSRIQVPNRHLLPGLVTFLRRADVPGQEIRLVFEQLESVSWDAVCQLYSWAVAKYERGGRLVLEFATEQGWRTANRAGLVQDHGCLATVPPPELQDAADDVQDATPEEE